MSVLGRIEEIVKKAADAGERELPRNLMAKVSVLLREQVATHAERERVIAQATEGFGRRYAAQLRTALERSANEAPVAPPPPAIPAPSSARKPAAPRSAASPVTRTRGLTTRHVDAAARQLSRVPAGLRVFYQGVGATIELPGMVLDDGRSFDAPTPAAMWVSRGEHVNGWSVWKLADGRSLQECWDAGDWPDL